MINFSRGKEDNRFNINNPSLRTWNKVERYFYIRIRVRIFRQFIRYIYIYIIISKTADVILRTHVGSSFARF